jgi:hypothetical protein
VDIGMTKLMEKVVKAQTRQRTNRAKLFHVVQRIFEETNHQHVLSGAYSAVKDKPELANAFIVAAAATDYEFPASEFATEVAKMRTKLLAAAKEKAVAAKEKAAAKAAAEKAAAAMAEAEKARIQGQSR